LVEIWAVFAIFPNPFAENPVKTNTER